jgi:hypothetical protein
MTEQEKRGYDEICKLINGGYEVISANQSTIGNYINGIKEKYPKKAIGLEISLLYQVPRDHSINQEIDRLRKLYDETPET